ncbi:hypothetical protein BAY59_16390 [Prauserella coralliicola]|nr:hypothetical protein BAY59_16390 [Prauserella coralliicola]
MQGHSPLEPGPALWPIAGTLFPLSLASANLARRFRLLAVTCVGLAIVVAGMVLLGPATHTSSARPSTEALPEAADGSLMGVLAVAEPSGPAGGRLVDVAQKAFSHGRRHSRLAAAGIVTAAPAACRARAEP